MTPNNLYIDGQWREASDGSRWDVLDPATEEVVTSVPMATSADVESALAAAQAGFSRWRSTGAWETS